jgi:ubiquinone biosynthesis monooxygenase Coq7
MRQYSLFDQMILRFDSILNSNLETKQTKSINTIIAATDSNYSKNTLLNEAEKKLSTSLMRINHSGEVCAQALYLGQAFVARRSELTKHLFQAADEEKRHLEWCSTRIKALGGRTSYLNPVWAAGSFTIGSLAGLFGDQWSLGFLAETEKQVTAHLEKHLNKLPIHDQESRAILEKMKEDEMQHANHAISLGGVPLPRAIRFSMKCFSTIMTRISYYV